MGIDSHRIKNIVELVAALKLTPRQIQEVFRILGHVFETSEENEGRLLWYLGLGTIAMAAFKVGNPRIFCLLGSQQLDPKEAFLVLTNLLGDRHVEWWFTLFLTGGGLKVGDEESDRDIMTKVGLIQEGQESKILDNLGQWYEGHGGAAFRKICSDLRKD